MAGTGAVTCGIGHAGRDAVVRFAQCGNICRRNGHAPVAAGVSGGGVVNAVQGHRDSGAVRLVAGSGELKILALLGRVDHVIARQGINGNHRCRQGDVNVMRCCGAVARLVGEGCGDRVVTVHQRANVRGWYANAPVT